MFTVIIILNLKIVVNTNCIQIMIMVYASSFIKQLIFTSIKTMPYLKIIDI